MDPSAVNGRNAAMELLRSGKVDPTPLITRTFPLSAAPEAIRFAQRAGVMKVLLRNGP